MKRSLGDVMKITAQLAIQTLTQIENPNYLGINAMIYSTAITTKEHLNNLNKNCTKNIPKGKVPPFT